MPGPSSITGGYAAIKRMSAIAGRKRFRLLVNRASDAETFDLINKNMALYIANSTGLRLDTWTLNRAIPKVNLAGATNQVCELVPVPESEHLGVQYLLRLSLQCGPLQNTLRLTEMEAVVCPGPYAGTARVVYLTAGKPSFSTVSVSAVRGLAGASVAPLP